MAVVHRDLDGLRAERELEQRIAAGRVMERADPRACRWSDADEHKNPSGQRQIEARVPSRLLPRMAPESWSTDYGRVVCRRQMPLWING